MALVSVAAQNASLAMSYGASHGSLAPDNLEVALYVGDPANGGTELSATGGYVAVTVANDGATWPDAPADGAITSAPIAFAASTDAWSDTADWWLIRDADTGDAWDSGLLSDPVGVFRAGVVARPSLTAFYEDPGV